MNRSLRPSALPLPSPLRSALPATLLLAFVLLGVLLLGFSPPAGAESVALVGATVHPISSEPLVGATLVFEDGRITAIGVDVNLPADAQIVDVSGKHIYPGMIDALTALGLVEISAVDSTIDTTEIGQVNPHVRTQVAFHPGSQLLPVTVSGGVLVAHTVPSGGLFSGISSVMRLEGWTWEGMSVRGDAGLHLRFPRFTAPAFGPPQSEEQLERQRTEALKTLNTWMDQARVYHAAQRAVDAGNAEPFAFDPKLAALTRLFEGAPGQGSLPLYIHADEVQQVEGALEWLDEQDDLAAPVVLVVGPDGALLADEFAERGLPVLLSGVHRNPSRTWDGYDHAFDAAARLHDAGVTFAICGRGISFGSANTRNLPLQAATAVAYGLDPDAALRSITLSAAKILGVGDQLGSLEVGKEATLIVTDGNPLEVRTRIEQAWIAGEHFDERRDRQKLLYERHRGRPQRSVEPTAQP